MSRRIILSWCISFASFLANETNKNNLIAFSPLDQKDIKGIPITTIEKIKNAESKMKINTKTKVENSCNIVSLLNC